MYTNPNSVTYSYLAQNFTSVITRAIKPPPACNRGRVVDIMVAVTTLFTQVTTAGFVRVGTVASDALYAELSMGAAAANSAYSTRDVAGSIKKQIDMVGDAISAIQLKTVAPTGGSPAGVGDVFLTIDWS